MLSELVLRVRHAIYRTFAEGGIPLSATIADRFNLPADEIRLAYTRLNEVHAIVLDPHSKEVRMALPFSAVPTPHLVTSGERSWYANCAWDALAIPSLMKCDARIDTACGDCDAPMVYRVEQGRLLGTLGVAHFAVPAARWWDDIGYT
jgi:hypothetical protein